MRKKLLLAASFLLFSLSFYFFSIYDIRINDIATLPLKLVSSFSNVSAIFSFSHIVAVVVFLVLQLSAFVLIGIYALKDVSKYRLRLPVACGTAACLVGLFFIDLTIVYMMFCLGLMLSCYLSAKYFPKFYDEYKVWRYYRTGSAIVKLALIVISISVAAGIFLEATSDKSIRSSVYNATLDTLRSGIDFEVNASGIPGYSNLSASEKARIDENIRKQNEQARIQVDNLIRTQLDSPLLRSYINNIGAITAITILFALLFLRGIVAPIGGALSFAILTFTQRKKHHAHHEHKGVI